jgi:hypothetical protein
MIFTNILDLIMKYFQAFCIHFSCIKEAAALYHLLRELEFGTVTGADNQTETRSTFYKCMAYLSG